MSGASFSIFSTTESFEIDCTDAISFLKLDQVEKGPDMKSVITFKLNKVRRPHAPRQSFQALLAHKKGEVGKNAWLFWQYQKKR